MQIAGIKGMVAGIVNTGIALAWGDSLPDMVTIAAAGIVGALGYGVSLVLFVLACGIWGARALVRIFPLRPSLVWRFL